MSHIVKVQFKSGMASQEWMGGEEGKRERQEKKKRRKTSKRRETDRSRSLGFRDSFHFYLLDFFEDRGRAVDG